MTQTTFSPIKLLKKDEGKENEEILFMQEFVVNNRVVSAVFMLRICR
jgi:hypothetical protein